MIYTNGNIKDISLGNIVLKSIYIGSDLVYQKSGVVPPSPLPYDSKVEYLASDGNAYIDTGITVNLGAVKFLIDMNIPSNSLSGNQVVHGIGTTAPNWFGQANGKYGAGGTANSSI